MSCWPSSPTLLTVFVDEIKEETRLWRNHQWQLRLRRILHLATSSTPHHLRTPVTKCLVQMPSCFMLRDGMGVPVMSTLTVPTRKWHSEDGTTTVSGPPRRWPRVPSGFYYNRLKKGENPTGKNVTLLWSRERGGGGKSTKNGCSLFQAQRKSSSGDPERQSRSTSHFPSTSNFLHTNFQNFQKGFTVLVYYESIKRELKLRPIYECRCDERLKTKAEESTRLAYGLGFRVLLIMNQ